MTNLVATETQTPPNHRLSVGTHISQAIFPTAHFHLIDGLLVQQQVCKVVVEVPRIPQDRKSHEMSTTGLISVGPEQGAQSTHIDMGSCA